MKLKREFICKLLILLIFATGLFIFDSEELSSQQPKRKIKALPQQQTQVTKPLFPDEYSDLDAQRKKEFEFDESFFNTLEQSRQKYLQALILIQRGDTTKAAQFFEEAIVTLNLIASYPGIERNEEFTDLAQSIIEDYESFVQKAEFLDENSSIFIVRNVLYHEIEKIEVPEVAGLDFKSIYYQKEPGLMSAPNTLAIPLDDNEFVQRNIQFLTTGRGRKIFTTWLERSSKWFPMMQRIAEQEGMPQEILYLSMIESALNPTIVSSARAVGLWQFIRTTGQMYGLNADNSLWIDERRDPEKATRAAMRHLRDLYIQFGDWHLAMAAYNCGAGCVSRAVRRTTGDIDFWNVRRNLPRETKHYVPQYIAAAMVAMNPQAYGFNLDSLNFQPEYVYDVYPIREPISLDALAKAAHIDVDELRALNTELIRNSTPPDVQEYYLKIPKGIVEEFAFNLTLLTEEEKRPFQVHIVKRNETLNAISNSYGIAVDDIVAVNNLSGNRAKLQVGQELTIPVVPKSNDESLADYSNANTTPLAQAGGTPIQNVANTELKDNEENITHIVKQGETLFSIARRYGVRVADIRNYNNFSYNDDNIRTGQNIIIGKKPKLVSDAPQTNVTIVQDLPKQSESQQKVIRHQVKRGETLARIADEYGVTISQIREENNLSSTQINVSQVLKITTDNDGSGKSTARVAETAKQETRKALTHKVKRGETIGTISARYGLSERELRNLNAGKISGNTIYAGSVLKVYESDEKKGSAASSQSNVNVSPKYYKIQRGDTLSGIANKFGVSVNSIMDLNKNLNARKLSIGQNIRIQ